MNEKRSRETSVPIASETAQFCYCDLLLASEVLHIPVLDLFAPDTLEPLLNTIEVCIAACIFAHI
jgi:hypothetical protein